MRVLVTGSTGQVGRHVLDLARARGDVAAGLARTGERACDLTDSRGVHDLVTRFAPDLIVHTAAMTDVDGCEADPDRAFAVNEGGTVHVAAAARSTGAHLVYVSTDYVYDGEKDGAYVETDPTRPLSVYGRSKLAGERAAGARATVVRTSWVCGYDGRNVVRTVLTHAWQRRPLRFVDDQVGQPTFVRDLGPRLLDLGIDRRSGVWHVTNVGAMSWYELVRRVLVVAGLDPDLVTPISTDELDPPRPAPRPRSSVLDNMALRTAGYPPMPSVAAALPDLVAHLRAELGPVPGTS